MAGDPIDHAGVGAERPAEDEGGRQRSPRRGPGQAGLSRWAQGAMLLLCLAAALSLRLHRADVPLERDEGHSPEKLVEHIASLDAQIADLEEVPVGTVKSRLFRGRRRLQ